MFLSPDEKESGRWKGEEGMREETKADLRLTAPEEDSGWGLILAHVSSTTIQSHAITASIATYRLKKILMEDY